MITNVMISKTLREEQKQKIQNFFNSIIIQQKLKIPYPLKAYYNSVIPLNIFQT